MFKLNYHILKLNTMPNWRRLEEWKKSPARYLMWISLSSPDLMRISLRWSEVTSCDCMTTLVNEMYVLLIQYEYYSVMLKLFVVGNHSDFG